MHVVLQVLLLGIVEGLTEFIPVSSTGHLILVAEFIDLNLTNKDSFKIFIQLGAILSVLVIYRQTFLQLLLGIKNKSWSTKEFSLVHITIACIPAFIAGFFLHSLLKLYLFNSVTVALALIFGGVVMVLIERMTISYTATNLNQITLKQALLVGTVQCFSLWPGMSRSGSTIIGGMLSGLDRKTAAEFSFIVAVPVMFAAVVYDTYKTLPQIDTTELGMFALGFAIAFIVALLSIKLLLAILQRYSLAVFGIYRIILGVLVLWWFK